jgi:hypothetical protein
LGPSVHDITLIVVKAAELLDIIHEPGTIAAEVGAISDVSQRHLRHMRKWQRGPVIPLDRGNVVALA